MKATIKQLTKNNIVLFPQTSAEAVLVKRGDQVLTLDRILSLKLESIEAPTDSGLQVSQTGQTAIIKHSNPTIETNSTPEPLLIQHDHKGHIISKAPFKKFTITIQNQPLIETNGSEDKTLNFGDDFAADGNNIKLKWTNI